jgi:hypothetical protein
LPDAPRAVPDVQFSRIRFLGCTRFRAGYHPVCSGPQGGWLIRFRSDLSGMRVLSGRRAAVETFPLSWAFPTADYDARYDSPTAYGGRSRCQDCSASLARDAARRGGSRIGPSPGFPCRASRAVDHTPSLPSCRSCWGLPRSSTPLFLHATA